MSKDNRSVLGGPPSMFDLLGEAVSRSPVFQQLIANRQIQPVPRVQPITTRSRDWQHSFDVVGKAGELIELRYESTTRCRIEKIMVLDDHGGLGTCIADIIVGNRSQRSVHPSALREIEPREIDLMDLVFQKIEGAAEVLADYREEKYGSRDDPRWGTLATFFSHNLLGSGVHYDTCPPHMPIVILVRFLRPGKFLMSLFGKQVV